MRLDALVGLTLTVLLVPVALAAVMLRHRQPVAALLIAAVVASATPGDRALVLPAMASLAGRTPWRLAALAGAGAAAAANVSLIVVEAQGRHLRV
ncbi:MAG: hypothetical protein M3065_15980 [Actinomycetota bacterium]|nr:hypothetical protein [Actinomycetota bacterium]